MGGTNEHQRLPGTRRLSWTTLGPVVELAVAGFVVAVVAIGFTPVFARGGLLPLVLAAVFPVVLTAGLTRARRQLRIMVGFAAWAPMAALAAYGSVVRLTALAGGLRDGAQRLLTTALPADARGDELTVVLFLVWAASTAACELVLRRRQGLLPVLPPVLLLITALVAGAGGRPLPPAVPAVAVAGLATFAMLRSTWRTGRDHSRLIVGAAVAAAVAVVASAAGPRFPGAGARSRYDPREAHDPVVARPAISPLVGFAASLAVPAETVFSARAAPGIEQWRLTALDRFDGQLWTSAAAFRRAGRVLPGDPEVKVATDVVEQEVTLDHLEGYFLPAADRPTEISVTGLGVDPASATLLVPQDRPVPGRYTVVSNLARRTPVELRLAEAVALEETGASPPSIPTPLRELAEQVTADSPSAFGKMAALQQHFRGGDYTYDATQEAPSGHSLFHISELVAKRRGTAEQYASAFAALALALGYEARVAVGYRAGERDEATATYRVRNTDLHAWPEVRFKGVGWVPFEPSPLGRLAEKADQDLPAPLPSVEQAVRDELSGGGGAGGDRNRQAAPRQDQDAATPWFVVVAFVALGLALLVPPAILAAKARRRRRWRRAGSPSARVVGAWNEAVDRLRERRVPLSGAMTADEVVDTAARLLGPASPAALRPLAAAADSALFGSRQPDRQVADAAWSWAREVAGELKGSASWWRRPVFALNPLPLLPLRTSRARGPSVQRT